MPRIPVLLCACILAVVGAAPAAAGPRIVSVGLEGGNPLSLAVVAEDPGRTVGGLDVRFGEGEGRFAESSCRLTRSGEPSPRGRGRRTFHIPWVPVLPGLRTLDVRVTSGACGEAPRQARKAFEVRVGGLTGALPPGRAKAAGLNLRPCRHAFLVPDGTNRRRVRRAVTCLVNVQRSARGLAPLRGSVRLRRAARRHADDMLARDYFGHQGPSGPTLPERLRLTGFRPAYAGENVARASGLLATPFSVVLAWMRSDGHSDNLFSRDFTHIGTGVSVAGSAVVYTTDLARPY